jgi:hypothetical protein
LVKKIILSVGQSWIACRTPQLKKNYITVKGHLENLKSMIATDADYEWLQIDGNMRELSEANRKVPGTD